MFLKEDFMKRAAVLIGVRKAGDLPELQAVWDGVKGMEAWALSQGIPKELIKTITDEAKLGETKRVTPQDITDAVDELLNPGDLDQLIVYFAGHGVNVQYGEYWLLTNAIIDSNAAINVKGSEERARYNVVPHVVFISDACRTAAEGIKAQGILGSTIFPNHAAGGPEKTVDLFFATLIGDPALEIKDPNDSAHGFKAVYTEALLEALRGQYPEIADTDDETGMQVVRPRPLKKFLSKELPIRVFMATQGTNPRNQQPDARVTSDEDAWLSSFSLPVGSPPPKFGPPPSIAALEHAELAGLAISRSDLATRSILIADHGTGDFEFLGMPTSEKISRSELDVFSANNRRFKKEALRNAAPFGPLHFETGCGFKIRGAAVTECLGKQVSFDIFDDGALVRVHVPPHSASSVLLTLKNGSGVLLPAISEFLTSLTFDNDQLVDVAYEPSENSNRWGDFIAQADEIRQLRGVIASASRMGTFRLEGDDAAVLARRMQFAKSIDPSLALYAAHAYRDQGNRGRIREMAEFMRGDLGVCFFDIALLAGLLGDQLDAPERQFICPFLPMLSQSWALLPAYDVALPAGLKNISRHVSPNSLWTLFNSDGVRLISQVLEEGNVR